MSSWARAAWSAPAGSCRRIRAAPSSGSMRARSTRRFVSPVSPGLYMSPASNSRPAAVIASPASRRFETSFSGSWRRKTSMPLSAALATKRRAKSPPTGREPTRKRPRRARPSGVVVRRHGERVTLSLRARPARSAGCRAVVLRSRDVAALAGIDLDPVAGVYEERHLDDRPGLERRGLRDAGDGVALDAGLGLGYGQLDRRGKLEPRGAPVHGQDLHRGRRRDELELAGDAGARKRELLVGLLLHEHDVVARVVEVLRVLHLGVHPLELLACTEGPVDGRAGREVLELRADECAALARLHVLELHDPPDAAVHLDVHPVLELVRVDGLGQGTRNLVDLEQVLREGGEHLRLAVADDDEVLDANAPDPGEVDARLDGDDVDFGSL